MLTVVSVILGEEAFGEHRTPQLAIVVFANAAWLVFPVLVIFRMARETPFVGRRLGMPNRLTRGPDAPVPSCRRLSA